MSGCKADQGNDVMIEVTVQLRRDGSVVVGEALTHKEVPMAFVQSSAVGMMSTAAHIVARVAAVNQMFGEQDVKRTVH